MGVKCTTPQGQLDSVLEAALNITQHEIIRTLSWLGEQCVTKARDRSGEESWFDVTGNLRSSIGYGVYDHGKKVITSLFEPIAGATTGSMTGKRIVDNLASRYAQTYACVVVAGMDYADAVEARNNKDVLASTKLWAMSIIDSYLSQAKARIEKMVSAL